MQSTPQRDTSPERALRSALHRRGLRFRIDRRVLEGSRRRADIVFVGARVAIFVDGCFWHGCPTHGTLPDVTNAYFWREKIRTNQERDANTNEDLRAAEWAVVRVWEHDDAELAAERICALIRARQAFAGKASKKTAAQARSSPGSAGSS
jgi:DNA mismatch endonuclease (patch repair protein)